MGIVDDEPNIVVKADERISSEGSVKRETKKELTSIGSFNRFEAKFSNTNLSEYKRTEREVKQASDPAVVYNKFRRAMMENMGKNQALHQYKRSFRELLSPAMKKNNDISNLIPATVMKERIDHLE